MCRVALFLASLTALGAANPETSARAFLQQLASPQFTQAAAQFDDTMAAALPPEKLASVWDSLTAQAGSFQSVLSATTTQQGAMSVVTLRSHFEKGDLDTRVVFDPSGKIGGLFFVPAERAARWFQPDYANPFTLHEQPVTVGNDPWRLPGTLTVPNGTGPFPAVVLVHGSGPEDQDETIGPIKPFKDLAWGLATNGIAVLRYEKRTHRYPNAITPNFTVNDETVDDARAAVALLASERGIDPKRIYVLGHSLGGTLAPRIAQNDSQVAGLILLAGATRSMPESLIAQLKYMSSLHSQPTAAETQQIRAAEQLQKQVDSPSLRPDDKVDLFGASIPGSYFLDLRSYHPAQTAAALNIPILVLQGARDYQVTSADFNTWKAALAADPRASFKLYPQLTHLFMPSTSPGTGPGTPADYSNPSHVDQAVITDIVHWIKSAAEAR
ncbi:MAG TPA: alpha/beta fold hydrolase [Bryobacteraceae bacterium]|nr:alpha/beta fold hydrolase [Bryobacteraceae bacterium]